MPLIKYPIGTVQQLLETDLVTEPTRQALQARLAEKVKPEAAFFDSKSMAILVAVCSHLFPNNNNIAVTPELLASLFDQKLASGQNKGWRYDKLPSEPETHRLGLEGLEETAQALHHQSFVELNTIQQTEIITQVQQGQASGKIWQTLDAKLYFEELLAELSQQYFSHPLVQEQIGYVGMADAKGWQAIGLNRLETWEPRPLTDNAVEMDLPQVAQLQRANQPMQTKDNQLPPMRHYDLAEEVDVVVIGTGAGGAPVGARLAAAGLKVVILEAGKFWKPASDFATDEYSQAKLFWSDERLSAGNTPMAFGSNNSGVGVGGSTLHYTAYVPRAQPDDFKLYQEFGVGQDWPLNYSDLEPYYDELESFLGVSGPANYPWGPPRKKSYPLAPLPLNSAAQLMQNGCKQLGIQTSPAANAALSARYFQAGVGWRAACTNRGFCQAGCSVGAKASTDVTFIPVALEAGAELRSESFVTEFELKENRISGVIYTKDGQEFRQNCKAVFLAAGAIETPRLLLLNNLANSSGQVGKNFMGHVGMQVWGQFEQDTRPYKGIPGGLISEDTHRPTGADFAGGYLLQSIGVMPLTYATQLARGQGLWGQELQTHMSHYNNTAGINILGECLPSPQNYLELSDEKDQRGLPKPRIYFTEGENERKMANHADKLMQEIWQAAGVKSMWSFRRYAHTIGTARMGISADSAVVNADGRSFDVPNLYIVDNSVFPSSLSVNPALTIMALALRVADRFLAQHT